MGERGHDFMDGRGQVPACRHRNPDGSLGGWVADSAEVAPTATVGAEAMVYGSARVLGRARITGLARVFGRAMVGDEAWVAGDAWVGGDAIVGGKAKVSRHAVIAGSVRLGGTIRVSCFVQLRRGHYCEGLIDTGFKEPEVTCPAPPDAEKPEQIPPTSGILPGP